LVKKLLITGATGFLGWNLCQVSAAHWQVFGTYHHHASAPTGVTLIPIDLRQFAILQDLLRTVHPDAVIHLAALSSPNLCQQHPQDSYQLNVRLAGNLAGLCADAKIPLLFTSTDQVFDGRRGFYRETDPVCPINRYGEHKALAEAEIRTRHPSAIVCRMPLMFGVAPSSNNFLQSFLRTLRSGQELNLFTDEIRTPVSGQTAARGLLLALDKAPDLLHLGGRERISRYEFGRLMGEVFDLPQARLIPCRQQDVPMPAPRPADVSLDSAKAIGLGYDPPSLRNELISLKEFL
jgi:dTDP-4-dehydrorhamnose reductase